MKRLAVIGLVALSAACVTQPTASSSPAATGEPAALTDAAIRELIVGGWIVSAESDYYIPGFSETLWEEFTEDGAEIVHVYEDDTCVKEIETMNTRWSINDGVLITDYDDGSRDRDQVVSIDQQSMTLKLEDGTTGIRKRADGCGDRSSI
ncbi:MAG: lipocalin family protein [Pseudomonadota bacterium]